MVTSKVPPSRSRRPSPSPKDAEPRETHESSDAPLTTSASRRPRRERTPKKSSEALPSASEHAPESSEARPKDSRAPAKKSAKASEREKPRAKDAFDAKIVSSTSDHLTVRRMHRRDINRVWEFLKVSFRDVNRETVEYQRPRSKERFEETYQDEGVEQLVFEVGDDIVGYAECAYEVTGSDNWINPRYFDSRDMRPLYVEELATHPDYQGRGVGSFIMEQLEHLARLHGCTHLVLEVAENNENALTFYRRRSFYKLDAALFLAKKIDRAPDLLPPRPLRGR